MDWHTQALQPQQDRAILFARLGKLHAQNQRWMEAIAAYEQAISFQPDLPDAYWSLANIYAELGRLPEEVNCRQRALTLCPAWETPTNLFNLGNTLMPQERVEEAIAYYRRAIDLKPDFFEAHYNLAVALVRIDQVMEAIVHYQTALELQPDHVESHWGLGKTLEKQGRLDAAIPHFLAVISQQPEAAWAYYSMGDCWLKLGKFDEAADAFRHAIQCDPDYPWSYHNLLEALSQQSKWDEMIETARQVIALDRGYAWAHTFLGRALNFKGDFAEAIAHHQQACALRGWYQCVTHSYQFTQDWFSHNIPIWQQHLQPFAHAPQINILEIGSYQGMSACWLLDSVLTHTSSRLTCIDPNFQDQFERNLTRTGAAHKVARLQGNSHDLLPTLSPNTYQVIYIDGCHLASHVQQDALLSWRLLKAGGVMIFDDYEWQDPNFPGQDPKLGIHAFLSTVQSQFEILHKNYQILIRKIAS